MSRRFFRVALAVMMSANVGAHLLILQTYAWAAMAMRNLRHTTSVEAIRQAFDGKHPCAICLKVQKQSQSQPKKTAQIFQTKIYLLANSIRAIPFAPQCARITPFSLESFAGWDTAPLSPPPKLA